ncbi:MAG: hypothetical protein ACM31O_03800 [Bacteroidota bacterium]
MSDPALLVPPATPQSPDGWLVILSTLDPPNIQLWLVAVPDQSQAEALAKDGPGALGGATARSREAPPGLLGKLGVAPGQAWHWTVSAYRA